MSTETLSREVVLTQPTEDDGWHAVCHCTDDNLSACGLDVTLEPWVDRPDDEICPLCALAWPDDAPCCPWLCSCEECAS